MRSKSVSKEKKAEWAFVYREKNKERLSERAKKKYRKTKERVKLHGKQLRDAHPELYMLRNARNRAKKNEIPFEITIEDIVIPEFCPVLGTKLKKNNVRGFCDTSPTLDRVKNELGYVKGNVIVISWRANSLKRDGTIDEIQKVLDYMKRAAYPFCIVHLEAA